MRPRHSAAAGEDHQPTHCAQPMEPPRVMEPAPALDEAISDPGHHNAWGHKLGKNTPIWLGSSSKMLEDWSPQLTTISNLWSSDNCYNTMTDIFSFVEHNKCWKNLQLSKQAKGWWENAQWTLRVNNRDSQPSKHQPGGTGLLVVNKFLHWALHPGTNASGMGHWCWMRYAANLVKSFILFLCTDHASHLDPYPHISNKCGT